MILRVTVDIKIDDAYEELIKENNYKELKTKLAPDGVLDGYSIFRSPTEDCDPESLEEFIFDGADIKKQEVILDSGKKIQL